MFRERVEHELIDTDALPRYIMLGVLHSGRRVPHPVEGCLVRRGRVFVQGSAGAAVAAYVLKGGGSFALEDVCEEHELRE